MRAMLILLSMAGQEVPANEDSAAIAIAQWRERSRAEIPCERSRDPNEIVVCALRDADAYRVPFVSVGHARDNVPARTTELLEDHVRLPCGQGAIIADCGEFFGVSMTVGADGATQFEHRPLAR